MLIAADIISHVEFNRDGELLATGDHGGRIVIFQQESVSIIYGCYVLQVLLLCYSLDICRVPELPDKSQKSWIFSMKFRGSGNFCRITLVLESR